MSTNLDNFSRAAQSGDTYVLAPLPYADNALEPVISAHTLSFHYGKHHKAYVDNLNNSLQEHHFPDNHWNRSSRLQPGRLIRQEFSTMQHKSGITCSTGTVSALKEEESRLQH